MKLIKKNKIGRMPAVARKLF